MMRILTVIVAWGCAIAGGTGAVFTYQEVRSGIGRDRPRAARAILLFAGTTCAMSVLYATTL